MSKVATKNAFAGIGDMLAGGFDALLTSDENEMLLNLDDIEIVEQVREEFEDDENSLADLGRSLRKRQLQAIIVRPIEGGPKPYRLVAGERRVRGARLEGLTQLRGRVIPMTDDEAEDAQLAENIHRKNLTQIEEAKKIQRDLDHLGSVEAVLEKHQKSRPWLSKMLALLHLPEQAKRLVAENVSADIEVINTVKTIEKANPKAAKALVDDLKATRGKSNAREKAAAVKDEVKPPKKPKAAKSDGANVATPKDRSAEEPGPVSAVAGTHAAASNDDEDQDEAPAAPAFAPVEALARAYTAIFEKGTSPKAALDKMKAEQREHCEGWLHSFYEAGVQAKDVSRAVIQGFRNGQFAADGHGAFALAAFLYGTDSEAKFSVLNVFGSVKE
ncbi:ParB/RepB/Spo0J family partition protein [Burkholderia diffusa]|uniref:ParB/RepB/Spo0J family partition protein n=1 Tax=Burkholderia diffusa TaxID=488732 RepID=UPI000B0B873B|nr:ParB/RepB/Spo0J family partition protein [Burkholderia diffusa]